MKTKLLKFILYFGVFVQTFSQTSIYVDATATGSASGVDWSNAFTDIQSAINSAVANDIILISAGTYQQGIAIEVNKELTIKGGYPIGGGAQDIDNNITILDGEELYRVLTITADVVLEGLTIQNGAGVTIGGGIHTLNKITINDSNIKNNKASSDTGSQNTLGGGIYGEDLITINNSNINNNELFISTPEDAEALGGGIYGGLGIVINNSTVNNNEINSPGTNTGYIDAEGGGLFSTNVILTKSEVNNNVIDVKTSHEYGGGIRATILYSTNSTVNNNATIRGVVGGIYVRGNITMVNSQFNGNSGGAISNVTGCMFASTSIALINSQVINNFSAIATYVGTITLKNSIVWDSRRNIFLSGPSATLISSNSLVGNQNPSGDNNIDATVDGFDPFFIGEANGNYRLQTGSPLIDAGNNNDLPEDTYDVDDDTNITELISLDLDGNVRVYNDLIVDIGPYESSYNTCKLNITAINGTVNANVASINGTYLYGTVVELTPTPDEEYEFTGWSRDAMGTDNPLSITMDADKSITANFSCNIDIPDANFKAALLANTSINTNNDSEISCTEAEIYSGSINVKNKSILDLTGIEAFTNITYLNCEENDLQSLDISNNTLLETLYFGKNDIDVIDVSKNTALNILGTNSNNLEILDLSHNLSLALLNCSENNLLSLDVSKNVVLTAINCSENKLTSIDISKNIALNYLRCFSNNLTSLNVANGNNTNFTNINFQAQNNPSLSCIKVDDVNFSTTNWTNLDVTASFSLDCTTFSLVTVGSNGTITPDVSSTDGIYDYGTVIELTATADEGYEFTGWSGDATGTDNPLSITMDADKTITASFIENTCYVNIPDANFKTALVANNSINTDRDEEISCEEATAFTGNLSVTGRSIEDLTGIEAFVNITKFSCYNNSLTVLDLSNNTTLLEINCAYNYNLVSLDISNNSALEVLHCYTADIEALDLSDNISLKELSCYGNNLTVLNLSNNPNLESLNCIHNDLTTINLSNTSSLTNLNVSYNEIEVIDVSDSSDLVTLNCISNNLEALDVSNSPNLVDLNLSNNKIETLDISGNIDLVNLNCRGNSLEVLDVTNNSLLEFLNCQSNELETIDLSNNLSLTSVSISNVSISNNKISVLDVSNNLDLTTLAISGTNLEILDLSANELLESLYCESNNLTSLNIANGNNENFTTFSVTNNPDLTCIQVDDVEYSNTNWSSFKDATASFSTDCSTTASIVDTEFNSEISVYPNPVENTLHITLQTSDVLAKAQVYNLLGEEIFTSQEKEIDLSNLKTGIYLLKIESEEGKVAIRKIIKE